MNRAIAAVAFLCLAVFLGMLIYRLRLPDLSLVIFITLGLVAYDLWTQLIRPGKR